jgi:hypothetical protein
MKFFKGDETEIKIYDAFEALLSSLEVEKDELYEFAYVAKSLGDAIFLSGKSPLTNAISQEVFRDSFSSLFSYFKQVGTAEAYINVFKQIFGDSVEVLFTVPGPGKLNITVDANEVELSDFVAREIDNNTYLYQPVIDHLGNNIAFQTVAGLQSEAEVNTMLFEMVPQGIFTQITLTLTP